MITFVNPLMVLLLFLPFIVTKLFRPIRGRYGDALKIPFIKDLIEIERKQDKSFSQNSKSLSNNKFWFLFLIWILLVVAAMRPVLLSAPIRVENKGRDILLVTDISTSMQERDFAFQGKRIDRMSAVKAVVSDFVEKRINDRLGLVLFGTRAYLQAPLTYDKKTVQDVLSLMSAGMAGDSTSIGDALGLALKTLKESEGNRAGQVIILLTDGENNDGTLSLPDAINMARQEGVKVYTIGVGSGRGTLISSFFGIQNTPFDEESLKELAQETEGRYFHASDLNSLFGVYQAINQLEPNEQKENYIYPQKELYYIPLLAALFLLFLMGNKIRRAA